MTTLENVKKIHEYSLKILIELGITIHSDSVCELLKNNGFKVDGHRVYFTEEQVKTALSTVPSEFTIKARNPKYDVTLNQKTRQYASGYGCPGIAEKDGTVRMASREDYVNFVKIIENSPIFNINGGITVQPFEINAHDTPLVAMNDLVTHSEKCLMAVPDDRKSMQHVMEMLEIVFGEGDLQNNCRCLTLINSTSPMGIDRKALEIIEVCCKYNQPVVITPGPMCGTTAPITLPGALSLANAEALACIVIAQLMNKGNPLVYGTLISTVNMKNAAVALGSPGYTIMQKYSTALAHFYNMPSRTGGSQSDAPKVGAQSGYESAFGLLSSAYHGTNLIIHSAGILNSFESMSYEKFICDMEVISKVNYYMNDIEVNDETVLFEDMVQSIEDGHFMFSDTTLELSPTYPWYNTLGTNEKLKDPTEYDNIYAANIEKTLQKHYDTYEKPHLDKEIKAKLDAYVNDNCTKKYF